jgi:hypothetical protein
MAGRSMDGRGLASRQLSRPRRGVETVGLRKACPFPYVLMLSQGGSDCLVGLTLGLVQILNARGRSPHVH